MPSIEELVRQGLLQRVSTSREEVALALDRAREELAAAEELQGRFPSPSYDLAYNAMLLSVTALLFSDGFRARVEQHHKTLTDYAEARLGIEFLSLAAEFERARRKWYRTTYGQLKVTRREAEYATVEARDLVEAVERLLTEGMANKP